MNQCPQTIFEADDTYKRIDTFLSKKLQVSKNQILHLIKDSLVCINGGICKKGGESLKIGDNIKILQKQVPLSLPQNTPHMSLKIPIIYEDETLLVLNKPPNLVVHKAPSVQGETLVDWLKQQGFCLSTISSQERYGIVHRLDKDTSGAIVIAKDNYTHTQLCEQLKNREMGRYYLAVIDKNLDKKINVECQIGRHPKNRLKMTKLDNFRQKKLTSRYSKSEFLPLMTNKQGNTSLIAAKLHTGRTHQIRAHLESLNCHILGDRLYGYKGEIGTRVLLHAYLAHFIHPTSGRKMFFKVPVFDDMLEFLKKNFDEADLYEVIQEDFILQRFSCYRDF